MNDYLKELVNFINSNKIISSPIAHTELEILDGGKQHVNISFSSSLSERNEELPFSIKESIMFMLLDAYIDNINPQFSNENFKFKYKSLPETNKNEEILKEVYRVFRFIRNNIIHDINSIKFAENEIIIDRGDGNILKMESDAMNVINFIIYFIITNSMENEYNSLILQNIYKILTIKITEFNDDIKELSQIKQVEPNITFEYLHRRIIINAKSTLVNNGNTIKIELVSDDPGRTGNYFIVSNDKHYLLPFEALEKDENLKYGKIDNTDASKFELNIINPTINKSVWNILKKHI
ncbi:hypothetical protein [Proteus terrae]|uniref:hypothetical protein n=1 Tax=Proteus terrae TaxID=1574161 RepID=UPI00288BB781|nr:hypothetical protein [Proteus terrae]